jgi:hypothetical protein
MLDTHARYERVKDFAASELCPDYYESKVLSESRFDYVKVVKTIHSNTSRDRFLGAM